MYHALTAPASWAMVNVTNSMGLMAPLANMAADTAGFTWDPEMPPSNHTLSARVRPITRAFPVTKMDINSKKVPKNSAMRGSAYISKLTLLFFVGAHLGQELPRL